MRITEDKVASFKVGDRVQLTQDVEYSRHKKGEQGTVTVLSHAQGFTRVAMDSRNTERGSTPFEDYELELVKEKPVYNVGDKVRIKKGAHGAEGYSWGTSGGFARFLRGAKVDFGDTVVVSVEKDSAGEIGLSAGGKSTFVFVLPEFLEPVEEESPKVLEPIVLGGEYWNPEVKDWYTVTNIDWERQQVYFKFGVSSIATNRPFEDIEPCFPGHCAPVRSVEAPAEVEPETVNLSALEEAAKYLKAEDFLQDLLNLAQRLEEGN